MGCPSGIQKVCEVNKQAPNMAVQVGVIAIKGVVDPKASVSSTASQLGEKGKSAVKSLNSDGGSYTR
jgi:hypothetical protein